MHTRSPRRQKAIAGVAVIALLTTPLPSGVTAQNAPAVQSQAEIDGGWPRAYRTPAGAELVIYQPQVASWDGRQQMVAYAAVSYRPPSADRPTLGTVRIEAATDVFMPDRLVRFSPV